MNVIFQCAGITGLVFVFYGLLAFAITQANKPIFWIILGLGLAGIVTFIVGFFQSMGRSQKNFKDMIQGRSLALGVGSIVYTGILIFSVVVAIVLSERYYNYQKDFTKNKLHTLSDQTTKILEKLSEPLKIVAFFDERSQEKAVAKDLLGKYSDITKKVELSFIDPDKDKIRAQQYGAKDGDIVIEYKGQHHVTRELSEQGVTQAVMKVNRTALPLVCFTKGHGELDIDAADNEPRSISFAKQGLANDGFESKSVELFQGVPNECGILIVAGPEQRLTDNEAGAIDAFLSKGGKSIWLLDPVISESTRTSAPIAVLDTGLEKVAEKWGVKLGKNFILEKQLQLFAGVQIGLTVNGASYGDHPVVEPLKRRQTVFERVRSVQKAPGYQGTALEIVMSAGQEASWTQANVDALFRQQKVAYSAGDLKGPVPFAVASEKDVTVDGKPQQAKLVVVGDSDFASNGMIRSFEYNFDLILNSVSWLAGEQEQISIRPKMFEASAVELTPEQSNTIFYVAIIGLPMIVLTFGLNLWWYRRRKG